MDWFDGLTEKQRRFCEEYSANGGNATGAAKEAGYKKPNVEGARSLENASIRVALEALRLSRTSTAIATREERQSFWTQIMRDRSEQTKDRLKAAELLGKSQADFIERRELTGADGEPMQITRVERVIVE
ncbi:MAG: terminase small subunit [Methylomicrobium sp.]|nr:terminase small subunit [Methylomicrobium sp.]